MSPIASWNAALASVRTIRRATGCSSAFRSTAELGVLLGDQIVGQSETRHRHDALAPRRRMRALVERQAALGHEHHAAETAEIGDGAVVAHQPFAAFEALVDHVERGFGAGPEIVDDHLRHVGPEACEMAEAGHVGDGVVLPGQPLAGMDAVLLAVALELARRAG